MKVSHLRVFWERGHPYKLVVFCGGQASPSFPASAFWPLYCCVTHGRIGRDAVELKVWPMLPMS